MSKRIVFPYKEICLDCAKKITDAQKNGKVMGVWEGVCPVCKKVKKLAAPWHDFQIHWVDEEKLEKLSSHED